MEIWTGSALLVQGWQWSSRQNVWQCSRSSLPPPLPLGGGLWDAAAVAEVCHGLIALRPASLFTGGNAAGVQVANLHTEIKEGAHGGKKRNKGGHIVSKEKYV